ncbi:hypothetical protein BH23CHL5_BH23CHL5_21350 [soil metagenome]
MTTMSENRGSRRSLKDQHLSRWECACKEPPLLLATYDSAGRVNIKVRDRYWHVQGRVQTICPRCGQEHVLEP